MKHGNPTGATVRWGDGHGETFTLSNGVYVPAPGVTNSLTRDPKFYAYTLTRKDGVQYFFRSNGILMKLNNPNGFFINPQRDGNQNMTELYVRDSAAQYLSFSYDQNNLISGVSGQSGRTVTYLCRRRPDF